MDTYAILDDTGTTIVNVVVADDTFAQSQGWVGPLDTSPGGPGIGWTTADGGQTWAAPAAG